TCDEQPNDHGAGRTDNSARPGFFWAYDWHQFRSAESAAGEIAAYIRAPYDREQQNDYGKAVGGIVSQKDRCQQHRARMADAARPPESSSGWRECRRRQRAQAQHQQRRDWTIEPDQEASRRDCAGTQDEYRSVRLAGNKLHPLP